MWNSRCSGTPQAPAGGQFRARPARDAGWPRTALGGHDDRRLPAGRRAGLPQRASLPSQSSEPDQSEGARAGPHEKRQGRDVHVQQRPHWVPSECADRQGQPQGNRDRRHDRAVPERGARTKDSHSWRAIRPGLQPVTVPWVDPSQYVDLLLDGRTLRATDNTNLSYFNSPHYNKLIDKAKALSGNARYAAYRKLAVDL